VLTVRCHLRKHDQYRVTVEKWTSILLAHAIFLLCRSLPFVVCRHPTSQIVSNIRGGRQIHHSLVCGVMLEGSTDSETEIVGTKVSLLSCRSGDCSNVAPPLLSESASNQRRFFCSTIDPPPTMVGNRGSHRHSIHR